MKKKIFFFIKFIISWIISQLKWINYLVPKNDYQILIYNSSEVYMNNYALYNHLIKNEYNKKYKVIYAMPNSKNMDYQKNVLFINISGILSFFKTVCIFFRSKYVFYDNSNIRIKSMRNQLVINLWHGTPLKKIGFMANSATILTKNALNCFDKILLANDIQDELYIKSFNLKENQILHLGYPRNDLIFTNKGKLSKVINNFDLFDKHIIWMTTYRVTRDGVSHTNDNNWSQTGIPILINEEKLEEFNIFLQSINTQLIIKMHNNNSQDNIQNINYSNIKYLSEKEYLSKGYQMYELLNDTDALITDYSSIYFDYLLTNKPIGFILDDYESYKKKNGLYYDNLDYYLPGDHIYNFKHLENFFLSIKKEDSKKKLREEISNLFNKYDNKGNNTEKLLNYLGIIKE